MQTIGLIGLGLVGTALAERFLQAGYPVLGYDLAAEVRVRLDALGGEAVESAQAVARRCDVLVLSLPDDKVVRAVTGEIESCFRPGQLVIDTSTGDPQAAAELGQRLHARDVRFLEATIAGSSAQVRTGETVVMGGGPAEDFQRAAPLLACFSHRAFHLGDWGSGSRMKLVVNLVLGLNRAVLAEGLTLAAALGLDQRRALEVLRSGPAFSTVMLTKGEKMLTGDFAPQAKLSQHLKDVRLILAAAERAGLQLPLSQQHQQLLERAEAAGLGEADNSAIIRAFLAEPSQ